MPSPQNFALALAMAAIILAALACSASSGPDTPPAPPATKPATPNGTIQEVTVGPELVDCVGSHPQRCLVVDGELFYDPIDGFRHQAGYRYRLRIERYDRFPGQTEIPQDTGRYGYRLLEILAQTPP